LKKKSSDRYFHYGKLTIKLHLEVYEPAEDTFLLIESISAKKDESVLEIGTGCGLIALECANTGSNVVCTDINPFAVNLTKKNYSINKNLIKGNFEVRKGDMFKPIKENEVFDKIIFNPPYLPTKKGELIGGSGWFDLATNGGIDGVKYTKMFIDKIDIFLKEKGNAYFIFSSLSDKKKLEDYIKNRNFKFKVVSDCSFNDETISVYRLKK
jgi:release factor glutamine methyltransferase